MKTKKERPRVLQDYARQNGVPERIISDNSGMQTSKAWVDILCRYWIASGYSNPREPWTNQAERDQGMWSERYWKAWIITGAPAPFWYMLIQWVDDLWNHIPLACINWSTPVAKKTGRTHDVAQLLRVPFFAIMFVLDVTSTTTVRAGGNEVLGRWLGKALDHGDGTSSWVWIPELPSQRMATDHVESEVVEADGIQGRKLL